MNESPPVPGRRTFLTLVGVALAPLVLGCDEGVGTVEPKPADLPKESTSVPEAPKVKGKGKKDQGPEAPPNAPRSRFRGG